VQQVVEQHRHQQVDEDDRQHEGAHHVWELLPLPLRVATGVELDVAERHARDRLRDVALDIARRDPWRQVSAHRHLPQPVLSIDLRRSLAAADFGDIRQPDRIGAVLHLLAADDQV